MPVEKPISRVRPNVLKTKQWLVEGRAKLLKQHVEGSPGIQVCARLTDLLDSVVLEIFESALADCGRPLPEIRSKISLVANGGYGRREMAPYSDVDLMLLHAQGALPQIAPFAQRLVQDLSDVGIDLGFSLRTVRQTQQMSARDPIIYSSLVDSRFLGGSVRLYTRFIHAFARLARRRSQALVVGVEQARREERSKYGETVYLLEPNVKRSRGGLRDLQLIRWIGYARYGQRDPKHLEGVGLLSPSDYRSLRKAQEFLLRLRNELHFHAQSACDVLYRGDQVRLAETFGYTGRDGMRPVEQFMQDYFYHTSMVRQVVGHFVGGARWRYPRVRRIIGLLGSHRVGRDFLAGPTYISATQQGLAKVRSSLAHVLQLMELTSRYGCRIDHPTWTAIRDAMMSHADLQVDRDAAGRFLSFLSQPNQLGRMLRRLHELRVLGKLVPGFEHARCLLQFNEYHKYTVDEHSIQAVERATEFLQSDSVLGQAYRDIKQKPLLHLALLVHDLGKGYPEDHSEVGARIAPRVAECLFLNERDTETLRFLVHRHLMLSHLAFRRDTSDESLVVEQAAEIGSPAVLRMLFVLTCADLAAVGPGVFSQWKQEVLTELYARMMDHLSGGVSPSTPARLAARRLELLQDPRIAVDSRWFQQQIAALPPAYLEGPTQETILEDLERLRTLPRDEAIAWARFMPEREAVEYSVGVYETQVSGIFHRLTGALTGQGLEILSAEIHSLADQLCLDRFYVQDNDYRGEPPRERFERVIAALVKSMCYDPHPAPTFRRTWQDRHLARWQSLTDLPAKVRIDNTTSEACTILDVFAHDRPGLLYTIARTLYDLGLSVATARIGTYLDQVVDVFYVTDEDGNKLEAEDRIEDVRRTLLAAIEAAESASEPESARRTGPPPTGPPPTGPPPTGPPPTGPPPTGGR